MTSQARPAPPTRWIRNSLWMAGLLIGACAHIVWWSSTRPSSEPVRVVTLPGPSIHVHVHPARGERQVKAPGSHAKRQARRQARADTAGGSARGALVCGARGCTIRHSFLTKLLQQPDLLGKGTGARMVRDDGVVGLQLHGVRPGSVLDLLGLRSSDTIVAIDDRGLSNSSDLLEIGRAHDRVGGFTVSVHRQGLRLALHHTVVEG